MNSKQRRKARRKKERHRRSLFGCKETKLHAAPLPRYVDFLEAMVIAQMRGCKVEVEVIG